MTLAVISPHLDDAIFSLGEHLAGRVATIICPFGGTPRDGVGKAKYERLIAEHDLVCTKMGLHYVNGHYLDDVYSDTRDIRDLAGWLYDMLNVADATDVWMPFGIHHPDHLLVTLASLEAVDRFDIGFCMYEELPYRVLYPRQVNHDVVEDAELLGYTPNLELKKEMCRMYASQIGDEIERCLYVPERLWRIR